MYLAFLCAKTLAVPLQTAARCGILIVKRFLEAEKRLRPKK
jgi:hypothetical protein